jgi:hypothetical protein
MLSIFFLILAAAPASGPYSREQLDAVNRVGLDEFDRMEDRCLPTAIGTPAFASPDIEAELAFFRMAELIRLVILNYPYAPGRADQSQHSDDVSQAVQGFERAYLCHPGWEQRHYLNSAMTLLEARIRQIRDVERRALTESEEVILQQALLRLRALRGQLRAPAACREPSSCPPMVAPPTPGGLADDGLSRKIHGPALAALRIRGWTRYEGRRQRGHKAKVRRLPVQCGTRRTLPGWQATPTRARPRIPVERDVLQGRRRK